MKRPAETLRFPNNDIALFAAFDPRLSEVISLFLNMENIIETENETSEELENVIKEAEASGASTPGKTRTCKTLLEGLNAAVYKDRNDYLFVCNLRRFFSKESDTRVARTSIRSGE